MISKKKMVFISILTAIVTGVSTFVASNLVGVSLGSTVLVPQKEYKELVDIYDRYGKLDVLEDYIEDNYLGEFKKDVAVEGSIRGMFESLEDPYSVYMEKDEFTRFKESNSGKFVGVGIIVTQNEDNMIEIISPIEDTPAYEAGLKSGDRIIKVDDKEYSGKQLDLAVSNIKGEKGTSVKLTIIRETADGETEIIERTVVRDEIRSESVKSKVLEDGVGYMRLSAFDETSYDDFKKHLNSLENSGIEGLVLDLRGNGGGSLSVCANIADELIGKGTIVYTEDKNGEREYLKSDSNKLGKPLVLLVDEGSASASEILAAAIQDTEAGTIVGTKTYGKGVVQIVKDLPDGSGFKLTISEYFSPKGRSIDKKGIEPDIVVERPKDTESIGVDSMESDVQLQKAIEVAKEKIEKK